LYGRVCTVGFGLIDVRCSIVRLEGNYEYKSGYPEEARNTCKGIKSSDYLNEVAD
jgi:hypothetical protein